MWQPIGTAPKDETEIIIWNGFERLVACWSRMDVIGHPKWAWRITSSVYLHGEEWDTEIDPQPTHWTPLPEPPTE
jgi:hypothetical protein